MSNRIGIHSLLLLAVLLLMPQAALAGPPTTGISGEVRWTERVELTAPYLVPVGSRLVIEAGTLVSVTNPAAEITILGELQVRGTAEAPVRFAAPVGWVGIRLTDTQQPSQINQALFSGAASAISAAGSNFTVTGCRFEGGEFAIRLLREANPRIDGNQFVGIQTAISAEMRSGPYIGHNTFEQNLKTAIYASQNSSGIIEHNQFTGNPIGITLLQPFPNQIRANNFVANGVAIQSTKTQSTPQIMANRFENNQVALANLSFACPEVMNNQFIGNGTAVRNDQYSSPVVAHNLFRDNQTAIYNYRKSNPRITKNQIEGSQLALFCDYSSYPQVRQNNFQANRVAVELGLYQSVDWERRAGSKRLMLARSAVQKSRASQLADETGEFADVVDVSDNWWGEATADMVRLGPEGNLDLFFDRRDQAEVIYEDFGPEAYQFDQIAFAPWLAGPVSDAGPEATGQ